MVMRNTRAFYWFAVSLLIKWQSRLMAQSPPETERHSGNLCRKLSIHLFSTFDTKHLVFAYVCVFVSMAALAVCFAPPFGPIWSTMKFTIMLCGEWCVVSGRFAVDDGCCGARCTGWNGLILPSRSQWFFMSPGKYYAQPPEPSSTILCHQHCHHRNTVFSVKQQVNGKMKKIVLRGTNNTYRG